MSKLFPIFDFVPQKLLLIVIVSFAFLLSTCKKEETVSWRAYGPYYLGEAKDYIYFKEGSWWVYKDKGILDTIVVSHSKLDTLTFYDNYDGEGGNTVTKEFFELELYSLTTKFEYSYYLNVPFVWSGMDGSTSGQYKLRLEKHKPGTVLPVRNTYFYPYDIYDESASRYSLYLKKDTQVSVEGKNYSNVVVFKIYDDATSQNHDTELYYAPNVGIIKKIDLVTLKEQVLVDYHVVQ